MKLMIDIGEDIYNHIVVDSEYFTPSLVNAFKNGTPIPQNATNGEILCSIFPDMHYTLSEKTPRVVTTIGVASSFDIDWWNSPYKRGETE